MFDKSFLIILPVIFIFGITAIWKLYASNHWNITSGIINTIDIETIHHFDSSSSPSGSSFDYKINLEYTYSVNGESYTGGQLYSMIPNVFSSQTEAEQYLEQFPVNSNVDVYYSPDNPHDSCLLSSQISFKQFLILAGMFVFIFTLMTGGIILFNRL